MTKVSRTLHDPESGKVKQLADRNLLEFFEIQYFDQFLAHQYCVRRFALHHPNEYQLLKSIRLRFEEIFADTPLTNERRFMMGQRVTAEARSMNMLDSQGIRRLAKSEDKAEIRRELEKSIELPRERFVSPILGYLGDDQVDALVNVICESASVVHSLHQKLNFFDYYDSFALTCFVSGKNALNHYLTAKYDPAPDHIAADLELSSDNYWHRTNKAQIDNELAAIVCESVFIPKRPPSNVYIFGHDQHTLTVNNTPLENYLILAVPTNETPIDIDGALRTFRAALKEAYIDRFGCYANVSTPTFDNSLFMTNFDKKIFLVSETKQYRSKLQGLWIWDLVHSVEIDGEASLSVDDALSQVSAEEYALLKGIKDAGSPYDSSTSKNYYDFAVKQIRALKSKKVRATKLDQYLASEGVILGLR